MSFEWVGYEEKDNKGPKTQDRIFGLVVMFSCISVVLIFWKTSWLMMGGYMMIFWPMTEKKPGGSTGCC